MFLCVACRCWKLCFVCVCLSVVCAVSGVVFVYFVVFRKFALFVCGVLCACCKLSLFVCVYVFVTVLCVSFEHCVFVHMICCYCC